MIPGYDTTVHDMVALTEVSIRTVPARMYQIAGNQRKLQRSNAKK